MDEIVSIITPDHVELDFSPAGIGSRLLALIIDQILVYAGLLTLILLLVFAGAIGAVSGMTRGLSGSIATMRSNAPSFLLSRQTQIFF